MSCSENLLTLQISQSSDAQLGRITFGAPFSGYVAMFRDIFCCHNVAGVVLLVPSKWRPGYCQMSYNAQDSLLQQRSTPPKMSPVLPFRNPKLNNNSSLLYATQGKLLLGILCRYLLLLFMLILWHVYYFSIFFFLGIYYKPL